MVLAAELLRRQRTNRLRHYRPYAKQLEFHSKGAGYRERLFMAGNQLGKTFAGAAEAAMHLTGRYPEWWPGRRFDKPITMLAGSESYELTRDGVQRLLVGPPMTEEEWGTGYIPKDAIVDTTRRSGVSGALDTVTVKHVSGGTSTLLLKAYEQGRGKWQANTVEFVWFDEEPPEDVYFEGITRTNATGGSTAVTFTPLKGMSAVVARYVLEDSEDRAVISMTIEDAEHYTPAERAKIIASYPPHEREARTKGIPSLGSGLIFPVMEEDIVVEPFDIPRPR
jgi:phage terminase large subunit-like protein